MKTRKPRTKEQPYRFRHKQCAYDDGSYSKECGRPWAYKCDGNIHNCFRLKLQWLASLSERKREEYFKKIL